jgi:hypothetical protein
LNKSSSDPHRPTLDDLNPESATTLLVGYLHVEQQIYPPVKPVKAAASPLNL